MTAAIWSMALVWFVCAFLCSYIAGQKRREPTIWFFAGLSLGFLAVLALIAVPALTEEEAKNRKEQKEREHKEIMSAREAKGDALLIDGKIYVLKTSEEEGSSDPS